MRSKIVAISAISSGLSALALTIGAYIELADLISLVLASIFVIMPLYYGSYKGCLLTYLVAGVIGFLFSGFNIISLVFPSYFAFFGIFPIVKCVFMDKRVNKIVGHVIGLVWFIATAYGMFFYYTFVMSGIIDGLPEFITENLLYFIAPIGAIVYMIYDRWILVMRALTYRYLSKVIK